MTIEPVPEARRAGYCVLVVDDDIESRLVLALCLRSSGYSVHEAADADEAVHLLNTSIAFDAVITDIGMPGSMNGIALAEFVSNKSPHARIVVMSGLNMADEVRSRGMTFVQKPYEFQSIVAFLEQTKSDDAVSA